MPSEATLATEGFEEVQLIVSSARVELADSATVSPTPMVEAPGETETFTTRICAVAVKPLTVPVAVMVTRVEEAVTPVTMPLAFTLAIPALEELQVKVSPGTEDDASNATVLPAEM